MCNIRKREPVSGCWDREGGHHGDRWTKAGCGGSLTWYLKKTHPDQSGKEGSRNRQKQTVGSEALRSLTLDDADLSWLWTGPEGEAEAPHRKAEDNSSKGKPEEVLRSPMEQPLQNRMLGVGWSLFSRSPLVGISRRGLGRGFRWWAGWRQCGQ